MAGPRDRVIPPGGHRVRSSVRIARIWGVDIRLHWTFLALVLLIWAASGNGTMGMAAWTLWLLAVFGSVLLHELAHCVVARRRGAVVEDILLTPIGGMSQLREMPQKAGDELAIAIVGPLASLGIAVVAAMGAILTGARAWPPTLFAGSWYARILWLNALLGAFNLLPALPMDGGRVLRAALARHSDRKTATQRAARVARFVASAMIVVGFFYDLWLVFIGVFLLLGASAEEQAAQAPENDGGGPAGRDHPAGGDGPADSSGFPLSPRR
jgi:Zn-dependent protease